MYTHFLQRKKKLEGSNLGSFSAIFGHRGYEIAGQRHYQSGDSQKDINWKTSAKHDTLFVNTRAPEVAPTIHLFADVNMNRRSGIEQQNAILFAEFFAGLLHHFHSEQADITGSIHHITFSHLEKPTVQKSYISAIQRSLLLPSIYRSWLSFFLQQALIQPKRRIIVIISDFLRITTEDQKCLTVLQQRHEVVLVRLPVDYPIEKEKSGFTDITSFILW